MSVDWSKLVGVAQAQAGAGDLAAVTVESALAPAFTIRPLSADSGGGGGFDLGGIVGALIRPRITVQTPLGPLVLAPYGDPPAFPWLGVVAAFGAALTLGLAVYGLVKAAR